jgi:type II secretory pathway pseudopilin PulG
MKTKSLIHSNQSKVAPQKGFTLIITISLLVLLVLIAVGLLSLSSITLRTSTQQNAQRTAQANARMAMMIAIGNLQRMTGRDQSITASANVSVEPSSGSSTNSYLTGAWRSWQNSDVQSNKPTAPEYKEKYEPATGDGTQRGDGRFLGWLGSFDKTIQTSIGVPSLEEVPSGNRKTVPLLSVGTLGTGTDQKKKEAHILPQIIKENAIQKGAFAWIAYGENQKANVTTYDETKNPSNLSDVAIAQKNMASHATVALDATNFKIKPQKSRDIVVPKVISLKTLDLANDNFKTNDSATHAGSEFHSISVFSRGLLTNSQSGGWRKDLSLWAEQTSPKAPRVLYNAENDAATGNISQFFYPWVNNTPVNFNVCASWLALADYSNFYKKMKSLDEIASLPSTNNGKGAVFNTYEKENILPVIYSVQIENALSAREVSKDQYQPTLIINPVVTLWNPYNFAITFNEGNTSRLTARLSAIPVEYRFKFSSPTSNYDITTTFVKLKQDPNAKENKEYVGYDNINVNFGTEPVKMNPGETILYSAKGEQDVTARGVSEVELSQGFQASKGISYNIVNDPIIPSSPTEEEKKLILSGDTKAKISYVKTNIVNDIDNEPTCTTRSGTYFNNQSLQFAVTRMSPSKSSQYYIRGFDDLTLPQEATLEQLKGFRQQFLSSKLSMNRVRENFKFIPRDTDGVINSNLNKEFLIKGSLVSGVTNLFSQYNMDYPLGGTYSMEIIPRSPNTSDNPSVGSNNISGLIITGRTRSTGLERAVTVQFPVSPLTSLGELSDLGLRPYGDIGAPPYIKNIIGNSNAIPFVRADNVSNGPSNDDSYLANRILFDDFFFSSIAAKTGLKNLYTDHVEGKQKLRNNNYLPSNKASKDDELTSNTAYENIASKLEVKGMFNVNSSDLNAWKSILKHSSEIKEIPHFTTGGGGNQVTVTTLKTNGKQYSFSRMTIADNKEQVRGDLNSPADKEAAMGRMVFTGDQIDELARRIVEQIKLRGPALSLSEFVNRRVEQDKDASVSEKSLPLAGAIQLALINMAKLTDSNNPYRSLQAGRANALSTECGIDKDFVDAIGQGAYAKALQGWTGDALPAWTNQNDVLRQLAPYLTVRDDTFTIRAYGDARDAAGNIISKAWCEATVMRQADYVSVDSTKGDGADIAQAQGNSPINKAFGRRYNILSFRYLTADEV